MSDIVKICKIHAELEENKIIRRSDSKSVRCKACVYNGAKAIRDKRIKKIEENPEAIILICKKHGHLTAHSLSPTGECRQCIYVKSSKWQKNNPEKVKKYQKKTQSHPDFILRNRKGYIRRKYGITIDDYARMLKEQNGVCAICKREDLTIEANSLRLKGLCIDHCHKTGKIRGLLCNKCNPMIGYSEDSIEIHEAAIEYLRRHS